ncbi:MAG: PH domain-containing protein [Candidatus Berkelbacteria bacterium]|nr:PH domain-containing protein [Candidatus Berkelbacteria bacterium]
MPPIPGKFFPTQISGEKVFLLIRRHWIYFVILALILSILLVPLVILLVFWLTNPSEFSGPIGNLLIVFAGIYGLTLWGMGLYGFVNYYLDVYIVTNERIVDIRQNGFFKRDIAELHLRQVQDVDAKVEGILQTLLHFGNIYIQTAGERENFVFEDVANPYTLAKRIIELNEDQIEAGNPGGDNDDNGPQTKTNLANVDDYRPEDYYKDSPSFDVRPIPRKSKSQLSDHQIPNTEPVSEKEIEEHDGGIKYLEENYSPKNEADFESQIGDNPAVNSDDTMSSNIPSVGNIAPEKTNPQEFSEGEEVKLDDKNQ